jgi:hypothetical protein
MDLMCITENRRGATSQVVRARHAIGGSQLCGRQHYDQSVSALDRCEQLVTTAD